MLLVVLVSVFMPILIGDVDLDVGLALGLNVDIDVDVCGMLV